MLNSLLCAYILRDLGAVSGGGKKSKQARKKSGEKSGTLGLEDGVHMDRLAKQWSMKEIRYCDIQNHISQ